MVKKIFQKFKRKESNYFIPENLFKQMKNAIKVISIFDFYKMLGLYDYALIACNKDFQIKLDNLKLLNLN